MPLKTEPHLNRQTRIRAQTYGRFSPEIAKKNAKKFNNSFDDEIKRLIIHGSLHLIGYLDDTKNKKSKMNNIENKFLENNVLELIC